MIGVEIKFSAKQQAKIDAAIEKAKEGNLSSSAYLVRTYAVKSIKSRKDKLKASPEGSPPFQHTPGFLRKAVFYNVDKNKDEAVIGFRKSVIGMVAATHEHGLTEDGRQYPERPTMAPALERNLERFHRDWRSSL